MATVIPLLIDVSLMQLVLWSAWSPPHFSGRTHFRYYCCPDFNKNIGLLPLELPFLEQTRQFTSSENILSKWCNLCWYEDKNEMGISIFKIGLVGIINRHRYLMGLAQQTCGYVDTHRHILGLAQQTCGYTWVYFGIGTGDVLV
jgi:hypothetical protein